MNVLLDTHILLWCLYEPEKLPIEAKNIVLDLDNWIYFSPISLWECEIKHNKYPNEFMFDAAGVSENCYEAGFSQLSLQTRHINALKRVGEPAGIKHNDPFDRMLMAQANSDNFLFLTHDKRLANYSLNNVLVV